MAEQQFQQLERYLTQLQAQPAGDVSNTTPQRKHMSLNTFTISRVFDAPRSLVWDVQTQPEHLARWMVPAGFKSIHADMHFQVGGTYHYGLESDNGFQMWGRQVFREIVRHEKIALIQSFSDKDGGLARHPMVPTWPLEVLATTLYEDAGEGKTRLTCTWEPFNPDAVGLATFQGGHVGMQQGFTFIFDQLAAYLAKLG